METSEKNSFLYYGELFIKPDTEEVFRRGKRIKLRKKEYLLLEFLAKNQGRVVNRLSILEYVWNYNSSVSTNTLDVHITNLRRKIDSRFTTKLIKTVWGRGYKLSFEED